MHVNRLLHIHALGHVYWGKIATLPYFGIWHFLGDFEEVSYHTTLTITCLHHPPPNSLKIDIGEAGYKVYCLASIDDALTPA